MTDIDALNARDLSTVACAPLSPHRLSLADAELVADAISAALGPVYEEES